MITETAYQRWMREEGVPVHRGLSVGDVRQLDRAPWRRTGGRGAFVELRGMEGLTGMYVGEIPPEGALEAERHLYEELIFILEGDGEVDVWPAAPGGAPLTVAWRPGTLFAVPLNARHRLRARGSGPALFIAVTDAPLVFDLFREPAFVFGAEYDFRSRFDARPDYFTREERYRHEKETVCEANAVADLHARSVDAAERKGAGLGITFFEMAENCVIGHLAEWPVGRYHKAHSHSGSAVLLILRSQGYTLMWPQEAGTQPYREGHADRVERVDWREGSVFSPPTGWFHQHFNTGRDPARQLALRFGSVKFPTGFWNAHSGEGVFVSRRAGGTLIEYEDEDPRIRKDYRGELERRGIQLAMPAAASGS